MADNLSERAAGWQRSIVSRDAEAAAEFLHPDYALVLVQPVEAVMPRDVWLATLHDYVVHEYAILVSIVDEREGVATVLQRVRMRATVRGEDRSGEFILSDVWLREPGGDWRVWRRHSTPLSAGELPVAGGV